MRMAFDAARNQMVMFGGSPARSGDLAWLGETWLWDGQVWTQAAVEGPSPRGLHDMAYDPRRERVVLFGGYDDENLGDTWEWDGERWTQVEPQ